MRTGRDCSLPYGPPIVWTTVFRTQKSRWGGAAHVRLMLRAAIPGHHVVAMTGDSVSLSVGTCQLAYGCAAHAAPSSNARMSSAFHATVLAPSRTGEGNRPDLTPLNHVVLETGKTARMEGSLTNPVSGIGCGLYVCAVNLRLVVAAMSCTSSCVIEHRHALDTPGRDLSGQ